MMHLAHLLIASLIWTTPTLGLPRAQSETNQDGSRSNNIGEIAVGLLSGAVGAVGATVGNALLNNRPRNNQINSLQDTIREQNEQLSRLREQLKTETRTLSEQTSARSAALERQISALENRIATAQSEVLKSVEKLRWIHAHRLHTGKCIEVVEEIQKEPRLKDCIFQKLLPDGSSLQEPIDVDVNGDMWNRALELCAIEQGISDISKYYWHPNDHVLLRLNPKSSTNGRGQPPPPPPPSPPNDTPGNPNLNSKLEGLKHIIGGAIRGVQRSKPVRLTGLGAMPLRLPALGAF